MTSDQEGLIAAVRQLTQQPELAATQYLSAQQRVVVGCWDFWFLRHIVTVSMRAAGPASESSVELTVSTLGYCCRFGLVGNSRDGTRADTDPLETYSTVCPAHWHRNADWVGVGEAHHGATGMFLPQLLEGLCHPVADFYKTLPHWETGTDPAGVALLPIRAVSSGREFSAGPVSEVAFKESRLFNYRQAAPFSGGSAVCCVRSMGEE